MTQDLASEEIKRAVLVYFGLSGLRTGAKTLRYAMARVALAKLLQELLGEGKVTALERAHLDHHERRLPKIVADARAETEQHLEPIVRSMQTSVPYLRARKDAWLARRSGEQQGLGIA